MLLQVFVEFKKIKCLQVVIYTHMRAHACLRARNERDNQACDKGRKEQEKSDMHCKGIERFLLFIELVL